MKRLALAVLFTICIASLASAQATRGYIYFAPGQVRCCDGYSETFLGGGGGAKYIHSSGAGLGAEIGILGPKEDFSDGYAGIFSLNPYYVIKTKNSKVEPFVTGGYSRTWRGDADLNWFNFGGGVDYWFVPKGAVTLEFRHHITSDEGDRIQLWTVRIGVSFR